MIHKIKLLSRDVESRLAELNRNLKHRQFSYYSRASLALNETTVVGVDSAVREMCYAMMHALCLLNKPQYQIQINHNFYSFQNYFTNFIP